jgi:RNA polymerase sigma-70 factor (ECF subfamily)
MQTAALPPRLITLIRQLERSGVVVPPSLRTELLAAVPSLRHFALSLARDSSRADDLVQETLLRAWANIDRFEQGTNLNAWLFTILRNQFHTYHRKRHREVADPDGSYAAHLISIPEQPGRIALSELEVALDRLPPDQREALVLVGIDGLSYDDAANICGVAVGTIKSRVYRARARLAEMLTIDGAGDFGPDRLIRAACSAQE